MSKPVGEQIIDDMADLFSWCLYTVIFIMVVAIYYLYNGNREQARLLSLSDSVLVVSMGNGTNSYYTNKSTIQFQTTTNCVSFVDNRTNTFCTACGDYIIRELVKETK